MTSIGKIAIIPARAGSKRLLNKNIRDFAGKPLFCHAIDIALKSSLIDSVVISSDSQDILNLAADYLNGYLYKPSILLLRPVSLATDDASVIDVLRHAIEGFSGRLMIVMLYPTYPLRTVNLVDSVISTLELYNEGTMITIVEADKHIFWCVKRDDDGRVSKLIPNEYYRIQDMPPVYRHAGAVHCIYSDELPNLDRNGMSYNTRGFVVEDKKLCLEVDDLESFERAENIFEEAKEFKNNAFFDFID